MILLLDNFDSFTYNLYDYLIQGGVEVKVVRNNVEIKDFPKEDLKGIVLSPGPGKPESSGNLLDVINHFHTHIPMLGICLGHQAIGQFYGSLLVKARTPMHGKVSEIRIKNDLLFAHLPEKIKVTRYHSLILDNITGDLESIAETTDGEIMAIKHVDLPIRGIQFHPEAILTEFGKQIIFNWLTYFKLT